MIIFTIKLNKFGLKISANTCKYFFQIVKNGLCKDAITVFCDKDQMSME